MNRILCLLYLAVTCWLTLCAALTYDQVPAWTTVVMAAAAVALLLAVRRETNLRNAHEHIANLEELQRREHVRRNGRPLNQIEKADWQRLVDSLGPDDPRSNAA